MSYLAKVNLETLAGNQLSEAYLRKRIEEHYWSQLLIDWDLVIIEINLVFWKKKIRVRDLLWVWERIFGKRPQIDNAPKEIELPPPERGD